MIILPATTVDLSVTVGPIHAAGSSWTGDRLGVVSRGCLLLCLVIVAALVVAAAPARANFGIAGFSGGTFGADGTSYSQASGHPYSATTTIFTRAAGFLAPDGSPKDIRVDLPPGFVGNPSITPTLCTIDQLSADDKGDDPGRVCPASSQVGVLQPYCAAGADLNAPCNPLAGPISGLFNMKVPFGAPAQFGYSAGGLFTLLLTPKVRTGGDYGLSVVSPDTVQVTGVNGAKVTLWGVPADPSHDSERGYCVQSPTCQGFGGDSCVRVATGGLTTGCANGGGYEPKAFLTNPSNCSAGPLTSTAVVNSWQRPDIFDAVSFDHDTNGNPTAVTGCESVPFDPAMTVAPTTTKPDAPTGLDAVITMPTDGLVNPGGLAQANLKGVKVTLPEGLTVNPSSADGLAACSDVQLGLKSAAAPTCPDSAKIGSVSVETPLLEKSLLGAVYVRSQGSDDPASGELFRLAIVVDDEATGIRLKLAGGVVADPVSGRLTTTFDGNPQIPFSRLSLHLKSGPRAPLATPPTCDEKTITAELSPWSAVSPSNPTPDEIVTKTSRFTVDCTAGLGGFAPSFKAGTLTPVGGASSPFALRIDRSDGERYMDGLTMQLPPGLLARLRGVPRCSDAAANAGTCAEGSRVGTATVGAGVGTNPFFLKGGVYLTGPYKGAPFGLAVKVRVAAGPFDLGTVIVRQRLLVDPVDAHVSVVSDPLPTIVKGVPVRLRSVNVDVDRPDFTLNPTSCARKTIAAELGAVGGFVFYASAPFGVTNCAALAFKPRLAMRLSGRRQTRTGGHPGLRATLTQGSGQANVRAAKVVLPKTVALDPSNSTDPKLVCGYDEGLKADCPASSVIGQATANTPLLDQPLSGKVHLVQGVRFGPSGNRIRTLPTLLVKLRGEVAIDLRAKTSTKSGRLVTTFAAAPDARVSKFTVGIDGGRKGILVVTRTAKAKIDLCSGRQSADVETDAHNGKRADFATHVKTPCASTAAARKARKRSGAARG